MLEDAFAIISPHMFKISKKQFREMSHPMLDNVTPKLTKL